MMPRFLRFCESHQSSGERRPGLAKPGCAFRFAAIFQFACLLSTLALDMFPHVAAALQLQPQGSG